MDFSIPDALRREEKLFKEFLSSYLIPKMNEWYKKGEVPRDFHRVMGEHGRLGFDMKDGKLVRQSVQRYALIGETLAAVSPGVAVATLAHVDLGLMGLWLYGSDKLKKKYGPSAVKGETLLCLGNSETHAGSDVAAVSMKAEKVTDGWRLTGVKAYVTNGSLSDLAIITAVTDPDADRNGRMSMFLVDLAANGVNRKKLNKHVWIPSDLTRIRLNDVFVPADHILGEPGRGLRQVLNIFTHSRVSISALTLGTAMGAFTLALKHAQKREIFGKRIIDFQAKEFEAADFHAKIEAARLMMHKAIWSMEKGYDFRLEASMAKYLSVCAAREVCGWAADLFGAASVMFDHPVHKFPMDAWAASLGEGTQDVQKLIIFREIMNRYTNDD